MRLPTWQESLDWLDNRLGWRAINEFGQHKQVPLHWGGFWYYWGGICMFLFGLQVVTGIFLLLYYKPGSETAFESVQFITTKVNYGWLIRSIHSWASNLMIFAVFVHMFSTFILKAYRAPREFTWVTGSLLLFATLGFGFTGYLLPWNTLAYFATAVGTDIAGSVPVVGPTILTLLRGGSEVSGATLTRFFGVHVVVLPMSLLGILGLHLYLIQKHGSSMPIPKHPGEPPVPTIPFWPDFAFRDAIGWLLAFGITCTLATIYPWEVGAKVDPLLPAPAGIHPEWYFGFMFQALKLIPSKVLFIEGELLGLMSFNIAGLLWVLTPFFDRKASRGERSPGFTVLGIAIIVFIAGMTAWMYVQAAQQAAH